MRKFCREPMWYFECNYISAHTERGEGKTFKDFFPPPTHFCCYDDSVKINDF